jgi:AcrR family transcriptional regulator
MTLQEQPEKRPVGRPRSVKAHQAIIAAALELLNEKGFEGMSLEAVATRAGVGKKTIYRRWPSKEALVVDALNELHTEPPPVAATGDFRADVVTLLREELSAHTGATNPLHVKLLFRVAGEIFAHPELFRAAFSQGAQRVKHFEQLIRRAQARGELRQDLDAKIIMGLIYGPFLYHALASTLMPTMTVMPATLTLDELSELTVDAVLLGIEGHVKKE